jgi:hypothetical protein
MLRTNSVMLQSNLEIPPERVAMITTGWIHEPDPQAFHCC